MCSALEMGQLSVAAYIRLQLQNTKDESRGTTQTCTTRSNERFLRSGHACVVQVHEFFSQIPLPQTIGRGDQQCRETIRNIFEVCMKVFLESTSCYLRNSLFSAELHIPHNCILMTAAAIPKTLRPGLHCPFFSTLDVKPLHIHSC